METDCTGGFAGVGTFCDGTSDPCMGACCLGAGCLEETVEDCATLGGSFSGLATLCDDTPDPCMGACCLGAGCRDETGVDCDTLGGDYAGVGTECSDSPDPCSGPTVYESTDPSMIVDAANAVGRASLSPYEHVPGLEAELYYKVDDGAGMPDIIKMVKDGATLLINF